MNTNSVVKIFLGNSFQNSNSKSLCDFSCIWTQEVEAYNFFVLVFFANYFCISILRSFIQSRVVQIPLKRLVDAAISNNIVCSELFSCLLFAISTRSIFNRCENCCRDIFIAHLSGSFAKQSICKHFSGHNSSGSEFKSSTTAVSNGIDILNICLIVVLSNNFTIFLCFDTNRLQI